MEILFSTTASKPLLLSKASSSSNEHEGEEFLDNLRKKQSDHPDPIALFRSFTSHENPELERVMGALTATVTPEQFSAFCENFTHGVEYVRNKFHTQPAAIILTNDDSDSVYCNADTYCIFIPRKAIEIAIHKGGHRQDKTDPFVLEFEDMTMMYGVEEAYHAHQIVIDQDRCKKLLASQVVNPDQKGYSRQPLEYEAMEVVHQAMVDIGIVDRAVIATINVDINNMLWAAPYLKARTTPTNHSKPMANITSISGEGVVSKSVASQVAIAP